MLLYAFVYVIIINNIVKKFARVHTKNITYFLAEFKDQIPEALDPEISEIYLMSYEDAIKKLQFESSKRILTEAHTFLMNKQLIC